MGNWWQAVLAEYGKLTQDSPREYLPRRKSHGPISTSFSRTTRGAAGRCCARASALRWRGRPAPSVEDAMPFRGVDRADAQRRCWSTTTSRTQAGPAPRDADAPRLAWRAARDQRRRCDGLAEPAAVEGQHPPARPCNGVAHLRGDRAHGVGECGGPGARAGVAARQPHRHDRRGLSPDGAPEDLLARRHLPAPGRLPGRRARAHAARSADSPRLLLRRGVPDSGRPA